MFKSIITLGYRSGLEFRSTGARLPGVIDSIVGNGYLEMQGSGSYSRSFDRQEALYILSSFTARIIHSPGPSLHPPVGSERSELWATASALLSNFEPYSG